MEEVISRLYLYLRSRPLIKDTLTTTVVTTVGKGAGFLVPFFIAAWFGIGLDTDAFFFAYGLVLFLTGIFSPVVESVVVPFVTEIKAKDESKVKTFLGTTLIWVTVGLALLGTLFLIISIPLLRVLTNFSQESLYLIFRLLVETIPLLVLLVATSLISGALNAYKLFWFPAILPAFRAVVTLFIIFILKAKIGIHSIAVGYISGELFRLSLLANEAIRKGILSFKSLTINLAPRLSEFLKTSSYQVIGMIAVAFNPIVDKTMASWLGPGNVSILEYADRFYQIPMTLFSSGLFVVLLSHWSNNFYQGYERDFKQKVINTAKIVGGWALLISFIFILLRYHLVNLVYGYGKFPVQYLTPVTMVWSFYLIGLAPTIWGLIFVRAHLVQKNTKILMKLSILNFISNILLNLVLIGPFGVYGLALSTTLTYSIISVGLYRTFLRVRTI